MYGRMMDSLIDLTAEADTAPAPKRQRDTDLLQHKFSSAAGTSSHLHGLSFPPTTLPQQQDRSAEILECVREIKAKIDATPHVEAVAEPTPAAAAAAAAPGPERSQDPATAELLAEVLRLTTQVSGVAEQLGQHIERIERTLQNFDERIGGMEKAIYDLQSSQQHR